MSLCNTGSQFYHAYYVPDYLGIQARERNALHKKTELKKFYKLMYEVIDLNVIFVIFAT